MKKNKLALYVMSLGLTVSLYSSPVMAAHCNVKSGDSMYRIAERYNIHFRKILEANKHYKNPSLIHPNDRVELPAGSTGADTTEHSKTDEIAHGDETAPTGELAKQAYEVLKLVNEERAKNGLDPLTLDKELSNIAKEKAADMRNNKYFSHESPRYGSPFQMLQTFGRHYSAAGENIAAGQQDAASVMRDWMNSSGHRANILNSKYKSLGVGYVEGGAYGTYWVQLFTTP